MVMKMLWKYPHTTCLIRHGMVRTAVGMKSLDLLASSEEELCPFNRPTVALNYMMIIGEGSERKSESDGESEEEQRRTLSILGISHAEDNAFISQKEGMPGTGRDCHETNGRCIPHFVANSNLSNHDRNSYDLILRVLAQSQLPVRVLAKAISIGANTYRGTQHSTAHHTMKINQSINQSIHERRIEQ